MKYSKNQINDMMDNLKSSSKNENAYSMSHLAASNMNAYCVKPSGEDAFTAGCEDSGW